MTPVRNLNRLEYLCRSDAARLFIDDGEAVRGVTVAELRTKPLGTVLDLIAAGQLLEGVYVKKAA